MKSYKEYEKAYIGSSDIASLTLRSPAGAAVLNFGKDGAYDAYVVDGDAEIGSHYKEVYRAIAWLKIYDDYELAAAFEADKMIIVYRAGEMGCIIQLLNKEA